MGAFKIEIIGVGGHGCDRRAKAGDKLYARCGRMGCPDCEAYDFVQRLQQKGMLRNGEAAYSVMLTPEQITRVNAANVLPTAPQYDQHGMSYIELKNPELVPEGATHIGVRLYGNGTSEYWASYPMRADFTHWPGDTKSRVVDDMLRNERTVGSF